MNSIKKFKSIRLKKLNNAEYATFCRRTVSNLLSAGYLKVGVPKELFDSFNENGVLMQDIVSQSMISDETRLIGEALARCDEAVQFFLNLLENGRRSPIEADRAAYTSLYNVMKVYRGLHRLPQLQQIAQIRGLVYDAGKADNAKHIIALKLDVVIQQIDNANTDLMLLVNKRAEELAERKLPAGHVVRDQMDEEYDQIISLAFVTNVSAPTEKTEAFRVAQNALIEETNARFNLRQGIARANREEM